MKPAIKSGLLRLAGTLVLLQSFWAVWFFTHLLLAPGESIGSLFLAPGVYLVEIIILSAFAALLPWLRLNQTPVLLWVIAGLYVALALSDLWTVGYYLSPALVLTLISAAYLSPDPAPITRRNFFIFTGTGMAQFLLSLAPFIFRLIF